MRRIIVITLALAGCAPKPQTFPHNVYCLTPSQFQTVVAAEPGKIGNTLDPDARKSNKQLVAQNILVRKYADGILEILGGCVGG